MGLDEATQFEFPGQSNLYHGKVRDVYTIGDDMLVAIASDRISAFDVILPKPIPFKGQVLTQIAAHFLEATKDIAPNWLVSTPHPSVSVGYLCKPFAIEIVVRSCLVGHAWRTYKAGGRELCGVTLKDGMQEYDQFEPIITPATKAEEGHDEDISYDEIIEAGLATKEQLDEMYDIAFKLFERGQEMAAKQGLLLADTKYEFGTLNGKVTLIDEIHTPDSSRYFYDDSYAKFLEDRSNDEPAHLSKEFVRQWLLDNGFSGDEGQEMPEMDDAFVSKISKRYIQLFEEITGESFTEVESGNEAIEQAINKEIKTWQN